MRAQQLADEDSEVWARYLSEEHARIGLKFQTGSLDDDPESRWFVREEADERHPDMRWALRRWKAFRR